MGPAEGKLGSLGRVDGIMVDAFGEGSDDLHALFSHLAMSSVRYAGPQLGRSGQPRSEEAEIALAASFLRKALSVCAVRGQAQVLLGRLEVIAPGGAAAAQRRNNSLFLLERRWAQQRRADLLSNLLEKSLLRRVHIKLN